MIFLFYYYSKTLMKMGLIDDIYIPNKDSDINKFLFYLLN